MGNTVKRACGISQNQDDSLPTEREALYTEWQKTLIASPHHTLLIHGILGGELYDIPTKETVWLRLSALWNPKQLQYKLDDEARILARNIVSIPFIGRFYRQLAGNIGQIKAATFAWDWRGSSESGVRVLSSFLRSHVVAHPGLREKGINLVAHSFGASVVALMLAETTEFDDVIRSVVFLAPAFGGALNSLQVLEIGHGVSKSVDLLVRSEDIQMNTASYPSTFENLIAPEHQWISELPLDAEGKEKVKLRYPMLDFNPWEAGALKNPYHLDQRERMMNGARKYHERMAVARNNGLRRLKEKMFVIVGLNGKTQYQAQRGMPGDPAYVIHSFQGEPAANDNGDDDDAVFNGDGALVFQSSFIPCIDPSHHWAVIPKLGTYSHTSLADEASVIRAIDMIIERPIDGQYNSAELCEQAGLTPYFAFIKRIDFSHETVLAVEPSEAYFKNLDYVMRWRLRSARSTSEWYEHNLDPRDHRHADSRDHVLFAQVDRAASRVLRGEPVRQVSSEVGLDQLYIIHHALRMIAPHLAAGGMPGMQRTPTVVLNNEGAAWKEAASAPTPKHATTTSTNNQIPADAEEEEEKKV